MPLKIRVRCTNILGAEIDHLHPNEKAPRKTPRLDITLIPVATSPENSAAWLKAVDGQISLKGIRADAATDVSIGKEFILELATAPTAEATPADETPKAE